MGCHTMWLLSNFDKLQSPKSIGLLQKKGVKLQKGHSNVVVLFILEDLTDLGLLYS